MKLNYQNYLLGLVLCCSFLTYSQVGVNTTNPQAQLDVVASNPSSPNTTDGFLVPRIDTFPVANPTASQQGMLVYLTTTVGVNTPGFYYWDNTSTTWKPIAATSTTNDWSVIGNSGTVSGTNFIGTTDNQALDIRTNNVLKVRITTKGQIEVLNTGDSVFIGQNAGANDDSTNNDNVFIGRDAGFSAVNITNNVAIGTNALRNNNSNGFNIAIGTSSLMNSTNNQNVAIGHNSFMNSTAYGGTAVGYFSGRNVTTGEQNSFFGALSGISTTTGYANTYIGFQSGQLNTTGNQNSFFGRNSGRSNTSGQEILLWVIMLDFPILQEVPMFISEIIQVKITVLVVVMYFLVTKLEQLKRVAINFILTTPTQLILSFLVISPPM